MKDKPTRDLLQSIDRQFGGVHCDCENTSGLLWSWPWEYFRALVIRSWEYFRAHSAESKCLRATLSFANFSFSLTVMMLATLLLARMWLLSSCVIFSLPLTLVLLLLLVG